MVNSSSASEITANRWGFAWNRVAFREPRDRLGISPKPSVAVSSHGVDHVGAGVRSRCSRARGLVFCCARVSYRVKASPRGCASGGRHARARVTHCALGGRGHANITRDAGECQHGANSEHSSNRPLEKALPRDRKSTIIILRVPMQLQLFVGQRYLDLSQTAHGGEHGFGRRKVERPVSTRRAMHLTLHSERARGSWSLLRHQAMVRAALRICARRSGVRVYDFANVGSHLHLLIRARKRVDFQAFLRSFAGVVARAITGARRGRPVPGGRFWSTSAWSRIVAWGRDYWGVRRYIFRNQIEATAGPGVRMAFEQGPPKLAKRVDVPAPGPPKLAKRVDMPAPSAEEPAERS
jgi:REP element-mobilizing transposase RayT